MKYNRVGVHPVLQLPLYLGLPVAIKKKTSKSGTTRKTRSAPPSDAAGLDGQAVRIHALMAKAERLYYGKRYRQAINVCRKLAKLDPLNAMADQMVEGCERELHRRRAIVFGGLLALVLGGLGVVLLFSGVPGLLSISIRPEPGLVKLAERGTQLFRFSSFFGRHTRLEYRWTLLDGDGKPVPPEEQGTLKLPDNQKPWECAYTPAYNLVRAADGKPAVRRLVASGVAPSGREEFHAEWTLEVSNAPNPPRIVSTDPRAGGLVWLVAGAAPRIFRVEASDGDGGTDLTYTWRVAEQVVQQGTRPTWAYAPPADALPPGTTGRELQWDSPVAITCHVANRGGEPLPQVAEWSVRLVRSNAPPQLVAFEPETPDLMRIKEGEERKITAKVFDPDEPEVLTYAWELDGSPISRGPSCTLKFPHGITDGETRMTLKLAVSDACGARAERTWEIIIVDAPESSSPQP